MKIGFVFERSHFQKQVPRCFRWNEIIGIGDNGLDGLERDLPALTHTLSPRRGFCMVTFFDYCKRIDLSSCGLYAKNLVRILPLHGGEGRGEGELWFGFSTPLGLENTMTTPHQHRLVFH